jgi:hypothetical protein
MDAHYNAYDDAGGRMEGMKSNVHSVLCTHTNHQHQLESALY